MLFWYVIISSDATFTLKRTTSKGYHSIAHYVATHNFLEPEWFSSLQKTNRQNTFPHKINGAWIIEFCFLETLQRKPSRSVRDVQPIWSLDGLCGFSEDCGRANQGSCHRAWLFFLSFREATFTLSALSQRRDKHQKAEESKLWASLKIHRWPSTRDKPFPPFRTGTTGSPDRRWQKATRPVSLKSQFFNRRDYFAKFKLENFHS